MKAKKIIKMLLPAIVTIAGALCLCACGKDGAKLQTPQDIRIEMKDGTDFLWSDVSLCDYYTVNINGTEYKTTDARINMQAVGAEANTYTVKVMANCSNADYRDSDWSEEYSVTTGGYGLKLLSSGEGYEVVEGTKVAGNLCITPKYKDKYVLSIGANAFKDNKALTGIILPEKLESINGFAFDGCSALESVFIPQCVRQINAPFGKCESLKEFDVHPDNSTYKSSGNCIIRRNDGCIVCGCAGSVITDEAKSIHPNAFNFVYGLKKVKIPSSIKEITMNCFYGCKDLESIEISDGTTSLRPSLFGRCDNLTSLTVDENNPAYRSENNCIIKGDTLVRGCSSSVIPSSVATIGEEAFINTTFPTDELIIPPNIKHIEKEAFAGANIGRIVISGSVEDIGELAFYKCSARSVLIENGVKKIGKAAFAECPNLEELFVPVSVSEIGKTAFLPVMEKTSELQVRLKYLFGVTAMDNTDRLYSFSDSFAYYYSGNSELGVENGYPYVISYKVQKDKNGFYFDNVAGALGEHKNLSPLRMGYTFGGWSTVPNGDTAVTSAEELDALEAFVDIGGTEYVVVYAIWMKDE